MNTSIDRFNLSLQKLEQLIIKKVSSTESSSPVDNSLSEENLNLKAELNQLKKKYNELVKTSETVINELNISIKVIDDYFKKQDANNKNT
jgi:hypothetical protein